MLIQRLLQLLGLAIVLVVAVAVLSLMLEGLLWLLKLAVWVAIVLLGVAALLRLVELVRDKQAGR